ncbi:beta-glucosidase [Ranunculus cassubicifolius]
MRILSCFFLLCFLLLRGNAIPAKNQMSRLDFPPGFVFGAGTSAYQIEGAAAEDGRKPSIWDTYTHQEWKIDEGTGDITSDQYHKYKDDVKLMQKMGMDAYRMSISWSRLIPDGRGAVNPKGLEYYNNLFDELVSHGIEPHVTLVHFDVPQILQDEYEGLQSPKFIEDFTAYADICFKEFGDRVKYWMTFNEPNTAVGFTRCFSPLDHNCSFPISDRETYRAGHNVLLSHAAAVDLYRTKYQESQKGVIGVTLLGIWFEPLTSSQQDIDAVDYELAIWFGWFLDPLVYGRYPTTMRNSLGSDFPNMTEEDSKRIRGSFDFIGINHYFGMYIGNGSVFPHASRGLKNFAGLKGFNFMVPGPSLEKMLHYVKQKYKNPTVFIHENGFPTFGEDSLDPEAKNDTERISFIETNLQSLLLSIRDGSKVRGFFIWSFLDCFEVFGSYKMHFGLFAVDFTDKTRTRYPRQSVHWYSNFLAKIRRKADRESSLYTL